MTLLSGNQDLIYLDATGAAMALNYWMAEDIWLVNAFNNNNNIFTRLYLIKLFIFDAVDWWGVGVVICLERGADCLHNGPADATAIPKPRHLLPYLNPDWVYLSGTGLPRLSWKRGR